MTDGNGSQAGKPRRLLPTARMVVLAALAGALAGAVAVYVTGRLPGNNGPVLTTEAGNAAPQVAAAPAPDECAARKDKAVAVGDAATGEVAALLAADPPRSMKTLAFNDASGRRITLGDRVGRTVLLNLWATWCAPCRQEMPALNALQKARGGESFEVMAVNVDSGDDEKPRKFLAETGIDALAPYRENTLSLFNDLKRRGLALGLPVTLLVDGSGCLLASMNGPADWASDDARRLIDAALKS